MKYDSVTWASRGFFLNVFIVCSPGRRQHLHANNLKVITQQYDPFTCLLLFLSSSLFFFFFFNFNGNSGPKNSETHINNNLHRFCSVTLTDVNFFLRRNVVLLSEYLSVF